MGGGTRGQNNVQAVSMRFRPTPPFYAAHLGEGCRFVYWSRGIRLYAAQFMNLSKGGISSGTEGSLQLPPLAQLYRQFQEDIWKIHRMSRLSKKV